MRNSEHKPKRPLSSEALVRAFEEESERKRALIRRSEAAKARLTFITEAIRTLVDDDEFYSLLEEEGLDNLPANLAERIPELAVQL
jgi:ParB family chromosome partitioning protein